MTRRHRHTIDAARLLGLLDGADPDTIAAVETVLGRLILTDGRDAAGPAVSAIVRLYEAGFELAAAARWLDRSSRTLAAQLRRDVEQTAELAALIVNASPDLTA